MKPKNPQIPYTLDELLAQGKPRLYTGRQLDQIAFPLGGIGTGSISLGRLGAAARLRNLQSPTQGTDV
jgi:hypothetical protein